MLTLIRGAERFTPEAAGVGDVLLGGGQILAIADGELSPPNFPGLEVVDAQGALLFPGLVDVLTHPCGGGGEGGFANRTAELEAADFIRAGITTPVGALGTDSLGRSLEVLYGKVMALRAAGLSACMLSGAYRVPTPTLTGDVARDLYLVDPVVGVGEVAISDHRGAQPTAQELRRLAAEVQLGGNLAGRGGTVLIHVGDGEGRLQPLRDAIAGSDLPRRALYPTHINRSNALLDEAAEWMLAGGYADITVSTTPELIEAGDVPAAEALQRLIEAGAPAERITCSSDAGGSLPVYVDGELRGLTAARPAVLLELLVDLWRNAPALFPVALAAMTGNAAAALGLPERGRLVAGGPAQLCLVEPSAGAVTDVYSNGRWLLRDGNVCEYRGS